MGAQYNELLADRTSLLLQLQGFAACGDPEVRDSVRESFGRMWQTVAETTGLDPVTVKAGLLTELGGVRAAYGFGVLVTAAAFLVALRSMPRPPAGRSARVDLPGALLLAGGLFLVLLLASETSLWTRHLGLAVVLAAIAVLVLCIWAVCERRGTSPLVDVRLLRHRAVAGANAAMLVGGVGMYLLLTLITRYAQTPRSAGYGFGLTTFVAGLVLVPFSLLGFVAGKLTPRLRERVGAPLLLAGSAIVVLGVPSPCSRWRDRTSPSYWRRWRSSASVSAASPPRCPASSWPSPPRARPRAP
jgi:hypothetical protein